MLRRHHAIATLFTLDLYFVRVCRAGAPHLRSPLLAGRRIEIDALRRHGLCLNAEWRRDRRRGETNEPEKRGRTIRYPNFLPSHHPRPLPIDTVLLSNPRAAGQSRNREVQPDGMGLAAP